MSRWRLVSEQSGNPPQVSTVILGADEIEEHLGTEATLHMLAGWKVTCGDKIIVCRRTRGPNKGLVRTITAVEFDPMHDHPGGAK